MAQTVNKRREKEEQKITEYAAICADELTRRVLKWQSEHAPGRPAEHLRFYKDDVIAIAIDSDAEQKRYWKDVRNKLELTSPYFLSYVGMKRKNDPYDLNTGPWVWTDGVDPALRVSLDAHTYRVKKGMTASERKRAVRKSQIMGPQEFAAAICRFGIKPKELVDACRAYEMNLPEDLEKVLLEPPKER